MPQAITTRIIEFLKTNAALIPLDTFEERRAFLYEAIPEFHQLYGDLNFQLVPNVFITLLIQKLEQYERLGRGAGLIVAVLNAAGNRVGEQERQRCDKLVTEWETYCQTPLDIERYAGQHKWYEYHIFLSYDEQFEYWVNDPFLFEFKRLLGNFLGNVPAILAIPQTEVWTPELKHKLLRSCCIVPVWCPERFQSSWWIHECSVMLEREAYLKRLYPDQSLRLIFPVIISDCQDKPSIGQQIPAQFKLDGILDYILPGIALRQTANYSKFVYKMTHWIETTVSVSVQFMQHTSWGEEWLQNPEPSLHAEPISAVEQSKQAYQSIWGHT